MNKLHIKSEMEELQRIYAFCDELGVDDKVLLALEEATVNVALYSNASYIDLTYDLKEDLETFVIEDDGLMFDPTAYTPCDDAAEELRTGGQGIRIIRSMVDSIVYKREDGKNILTLVKVKNKS